MQTRLAQLAKTMPTRREPIVIGYEDASAGGVPAVASNVLCPEPGDNAAIAVKNIEAGEAIILGGEVVCESAPYTVLEGHRVAVLPVAKGEPLLSWGKPFGFATIDLAPGYYVCNYKVLKVLEQRRSVTFEIPAAPTFTDMLLPKTVLDEAAFTPGAPTPAPPAGVALKTFEGFKRPGKLGAGTRNFVVILSVTSESASYAKALEERCRKIYPHGPAINNGCSGVVAVAHTEGGAGTSTCSESA